MDDIRQLRNSEEPRKKFSYKWAIIVKWLLKHKWRILLTMIVSSLMFFPAFSGQILGTWITEFVSNLIKFITL